MRKIFMMLIVGALTSLAAHGAEVKRYELNIKDFSVLKVVQGINVDYRCNPDSAGRAVFTSTAQRASVLMFSNEKGTLSIQLALEDSQLEGIPTVTVYSSSLDKVENSGDSTVRVLSPAPAVKFQGKLIGNGRLSLRNVRATDLHLSLATGNGVIVADGSAENLKITFSGTGTIQADGLNAADVNIKATGTGAIGCSPREKLTVYGAGTTKIYYRGTPEIKNRSIGIKTIPINEADK